MNHRKHGIGLLAVAVLGLVLFATAAQAKNAKVLLLNSSGVKVVFLHATLSGNDDGSDSVFLVKALNVEIRCTDFSIQEGLFLTETDIDVKLLYEGCEPLTLALTKIPDCHILDPLDKTKLHITLTALLLPIELAGGDFGFLTENINGTVLMTGAECVLPEKTVMTGTLCSLIEPATNGTTNLLVLYSEAIQLGCLTGATDKLSFGAQTAYLDARANKFVVGTHVAYRLLVEL